MDVTMDRAEQTRQEALAKALDNIAVLDLACLGVAGHLYEALQRKQPGDMCMGAARFVLNALPEEGGLAVIATGFPMGGGVPETDGPVGAAMLARALRVARGARSLIVTDEDFVDAVKAACIGAGLSPRIADPEGLESISYLNPVYILPFPREEAACRTRCEQVLANMEPDLLVAVERPGKNTAGVYHGMNGRPLAGFVADIEPLFEMGRDRGIPILGIGDGGNELGMGVIREDLGEFLPQATSCGCPCGQGTAAVFAADYLVVASVSNWGADGIIAGLAVLTHNSDVLHYPDRERRAIELCANSGAVDGVHVSPVPAVDGIPAEEWEGLLTTLRGMIHRGTDFRGDWRRQKHG
ncbi:DUF4392 domain-containing protein [Oceanidesulfovibrio marinus]|uniref:DUF4392 domain-containing protein n=2 Tax=Oceanidesulfovibrio marinus TaxID=370038 RepID=A0A6P1ZDL1_9BACT|nr:DUF4392 domain-containing protein [Oceanidesulfovibrio marinus]